MSSLESGIIDLVDNMIRKAQYTARARENARYYLEEHKQRLAQLQDSGQAEYVSAEVKAVQGLIRRAEAQLKHDPVEARDLSISIGRQIADLSTLARHAQREFEQRELQRRQQQQQAMAEARNELEKYLSQLMLGISDPVVADFAAAEISALQRQYQQQHLQSSDVESIKATLAKQFEKTMAAATAAAQQWKQSKSRQCAAEIGNDLLAMHEAVAAKTAEVNPVAAQKLQQTLQAIRAAGSASVLDAGAEIAASIEQTDAAVVDEAVRREVVVALVNTLRQNGFELVGGKPKRQRTADGDEVVLLARKPCGNQAEFKVALDGRFTFHFDQYEGKACRQDIGKVTSTLQNIYGIRLATERVLWENPDRIAQNAKPITDLRRNRQ